MSHPSSIDHDAAAFAIAPFEKGGDKTRQRLVGDLLFARRANPPSPALRPPAPFSKGGCSERLPVLTGMVH